MRFRFRTPLFLAFLGLAACGGQGDVGAAPGAALRASEPGLTACTDPRPEMCTREYRPVCAVRDTGIRCITTPCDSTEEKTYGNACDACSDPKVHGHRPGECPAAPAADGEP